MYLKAQSLDVSCHVHSVKCSSGGPLSTLCQMNAAFLLNAPFFLIYTHLFIEQINFLYCGCTIDLGRHQILFPAFLIDVFCQNQSFFLVYILKVQPKAQFYCVYVCFHPVLKVHLTLYWKLLKSLKKTVIKRFEKTVKGSDFDINPFDRE